MSGNQSSPWILLPKASPRKGRRLFCFPNAGGSDMVFRDWRNLLPESVEVCPILLPGRGRRLREKPLTSLPEAIHSIVPAMLPYLDKPFALCGHSMRADFELIETYVYTDEPPLDLPVYAFGGLQDPKVTRESVEAWREQTTSTF